MDIQTIVILRERKQGLNSDYDRLLHIANRDMLIYRMLSHNDGFGPRVQKH